MTVPVFHRSMPIEYLTQIHSLMMLKKAKGKYILRFFVSGHYKGISVKLENITDFNEIINSAMIRNFDSF